MIGSEIQERRQLSMCRKDGRPCSSTVADPVFPKGRQTQKEGRQPILWPIFTKICIKVKKIGMGRVGVKILLCSSATVLRYIFHTFD